jgi:hypothetical protein
MKNSPSFLKELIATAVLLFVCLQACEKPEVIAPTQPPMKDVILGEMREGEPVLTYPDYDRLKDAMKYAFPSNTTIDTVFLHNIEDGAGESVVYLTAVGTNDMDGVEPITSSINFRFLIVTGMIKWENPWDAFYCTPNGGCPGCIVRNSSLCGCTVENSTMPENYGCGRIDVVAAVPYNHGEITQLINEHLSHNSN